MISGGLEYDKIEISAIDEAEVREVVQQIVTTEPPVRRVVIACVFATCDESCGSQERRVEEIVKEACAELSCTLSHQVRTSQAVCSLKIVFSLECN